MLIFPTVVIGLEVIYGRSYAELIALGTASFIAFGVFSLPAGWLADRWSRRNMMALFYVGCGLSLIGSGSGAEPDRAGRCAHRPRHVRGDLSPGRHRDADRAGDLARTLARLQWRVRQSRRGVCGRHHRGAGGGLRLARGLPGAGVVRVVTGSSICGWFRTTGGRAADRTTVADVPLAAWMAAAIFGLFIVIALTAGLVFHIATVALPKIVDERLGAGVSLVMVGGIATVIFMCGALAQLAIGRLVERFPLHLLFAVVAFLQFVGVVWTAYATGPMLLVALAVAMAAIYAQVTVNDLVIARYTADAWRGRVYAVRYFLTFLVSGAAVSMIAILYGRGGFDLVLGTTAVIALGFVVATAAIALLVNGVEKERTGAVAPAE